MRCYAFGSVLIVLTLSACSAVGTNAVPGGSTIPASRAAFADAGGTLKTLYSFQGQSDGAKPESALTAYAQCTSKCSEQLLGTTAAGGANNAGTVYSLFTEDVRIGYFDETVKLSFSPAETGSDPTGPVIARKWTGPDFATAARGGAHNKGTIVELGKQDTVLSFDGSNGASPTAGLNGFIGRYPYYIATFAGGRYERGTIVATMTGNGLRAEVLYSFRGRSDGAHPNSELTTWGGIVGSPYYGTTAGSKSVQATVYAFVPHQGLTTLYTFKSVKDGATPTGVNACKAASYCPKGVWINGTTLKGGSSGYGTLYELKPMGGSKYAKRTLHTFGGGADGAYPQGPPVYAGAGSTEGFYGVTEQGGSHNCGTIFRFSPSTGTYAVLHSFTCGKDGGYPAAPITSCKEALCGTTSAGGTANDGTVFAFNPY